MMKTEEIRVLLIEDSIGDIQLMREMMRNVRDVRFRLTTTDRLKKGIKILQEGGIDIILLDLGLPDCQGLDTLRTLYAQMPEVPVVVLTGLEAEWMGLQAIQTGAQDYLLKGKVTAKALARCIRFALERHNLLVQLRKTGEWLQTILHQVGEGIVSCNSFGEIRFSNAVADELLAPNKAQNLERILSHASNSDDAFCIALGDPDEQAAMVEVRRVELEWEGDIEVIFLLRSTDKPPSYRSTF